MHADEGFRAEVMANIPASYSPAFHFLFPSIVGIAIAAVGLSLVRHPTWIELLSVPFVFVVSNATEWRAHKNLLHKRHPIAKVLYDRHTPIHHRVFTTNDMSIRSPRELALVLIPPYGILLVFAAVAPIAALLFLLGQRNVCGLFLATTMLYVVSYEWLHLAYHLPQTSFIGRLSIVRRLKRHHATHHDPTLMQKWNFNVTVPLWDWVRGTIYAKRRETDATERPRTAP
jgi:hypothetical protein